MAEPVWETLLLDAGGTVVSALTLALAAWLAHRRGWLSKPLALLGGWIGQHSGQISTDVVKVITDVVEHEHPSQPAKSGTPTVVADAGETAGVDTPPVAGGGVSGLAVGGADGDGLPMGSPRG